MPLGPVDVRPEERRVTLAAFLVLFGGLAAHTILENLLEEPPRGTVLALVDDLPDEERLSRIPGDSQPHDDYRGLLALMADTPSPSLRPLAAFHAAEVGCPVNAVTGLFARPVGQNGSIPEHADGR